MAERSALRTAKPQDVPAQDPFAELTRIIGFDPRVKVLKPRRAVESAALREAAAPRIEADSVEDWEAEFTPTDFGLAAPKEDVEAVEAQRGSASDAPAPLSRDVSQAPKPQSGLAAAKADVSSFEISGEIDEITDAFEREWRAKSAWKPSQQSVEIEALPDEQLFGFEKSLEDNEEDWTRSQSAMKAPQEEDAGPDAADDDSLDAHLGDALASSIELDFDDLLEGERGTDARGSDASDMFSALAEARPAQSADIQDEPQAWAGNKARNAFEALKPASFEDELTALLSGEVPARSEQPAERRGAEQPKIAAAIVAAEEVSAEREQAPLVAKRLEVAPRVETSRGAKPVQPLAAPIETEQDEDPFAALAAMAARYRSAQFTPAPETESRPTPPSPVATPATIPSEAASPKHAPEVEEMKRPSSVRYDSPQIDTVEVPEYPMATADDLDIPSNPYGSADEPQAGRSRYDDYDNEFDDLLQDMTAGEHASRARPAARPATPGYAPQPRQAAPRPVMPRASTMPEQPRMAQPKPARAQPAFDTEWDDYGQPAQAEPSYGYDEMAFDDDFESGQPAAVQRPPQRKRGRWFAALFGSAAVLVAGGAYALKFTGVAESGGPVLVKADSGPLKIRPENPGGAVVPNQDNQVYDRVAGLGNAAAPAQQKLNSSNEEPVSLDEPEDETADDALPGLELSGDDMDAEAEGKNEDRVDAAAADQQQPEKAPITVAPRKVRTMVVKPDGTLAAREDAAPAVQALASNAAAVIDSVKKNAMAANVDATASTASVTPSDDDAAAGPVAATAEDALASEPAVVRPDGSWSVQIASQPSEAAARSNYADLAKRYSSVLSGRTVNIVKAELAGKGTVWRVRVSAEDRGSAASLCTDYKAAGGNCFVTK